MASEADGLRAIFALVGIERVVWIDDLFGGDSKQIDRIDLIARVAELRERDDLPGDDLFSPLTPDMDVEEWLEGVETTELGYVRVHKAVADKYRVNATPEVEYHEEEIGTIIASCGVAVEKLGLPKWRSRAQEIKQGLAGNVLVLVDRQFLIDGQHLNEGETIAAELAAVGSDASIIMLTHSVAEEAGGELENELAKACGKDKVSVASKRRDEKGGVAAERSLRRAIRTILTYRTCFRLADGMAKMMRTALDATCESVRRKSVYELDTVVFQSSLDEGASELDVILRILLLRQRVAVATALASDAGVLDEIHKLRQLRALEVLEPSRSEGALELRGWRKDEVFDPGDRVNPTHAPLVCGDVFKSGSGKFYVLLAQPCDIAVRNNNPPGARKFEEAIMVRASAAGAERDDSDTLADGNKLRFFRIPALEGDGEWQLDFIKWGAVNLRCLDLAVFSSNGEVSLARGQEAPKALLPGWRKRFDETISRVFGADQKKRLQTLEEVPKEYRHLALSENIPTREVRIKQPNLIRFEWQRIGRLRGAWAIAAYAGFSSYQTRAAFEHDFAGGLPSIEP